jgi:hypothetical protein
MVRSCLLSRMPQMMCLLRIYEDYHEPWAAASAVAFAGRFWGGGANVVDVAGRMEEHLQVVYVRCLFGDGQWDETQAVLEVGQRTRVRAMVDGR